MNCLVTAGPTYEPLDQVRRLTNFSTGRLGTELANHLVQQGHQVMLLLGEQATWAGERLAQRTETFSTTADLAEHLNRLSREPMAAVFHAAAVSDFAFGKVWSPSPDGQLTEWQAGKIPSGQGRLLAELLPTPKIIGRLRVWFPAARIAGWKFEVEGSREEALDKARHQLADNRTDACVANGPAYGAGFGLVTAHAPPRHLPDRPALYAALARWLE